MYGKSGGCVIRRHIWGKNRHLRQTESDYTLLMKIYLYFPLLLLLATTGISAQITVTSATFPAAGD